MVITTVPGSFSVMDKAEERKNNPSYGQAMNILEEICRDPAVPRSVKKRVEDAIGRLQSPGRTLQMRINSCNSLLDDINNDPSVPQHTRTFLWQVAGLLEGAGKAERTSLGQQN
jgi:uncharacterized protein (UPF0147 family)